MGKLYVMSGPSGSGKSTLCKMLSQSDDKIKISVSATTRPPREGEKDGVDYFFLSDKQFDEKLRQNAFYEHAGRFTKRYGTLKEQTDSLIGAGCDVILEIDVQGAKQVREKNKDAILIFIMPPSTEELIKRLEERNTESERQLEMRIETAKNEMTQKGMYDYVVVNDKLRHAFEQISEIIKKHR